MSNNPEWKCKLTYAEYVALHPPRFQVAWTDKGRNKKRQYSEPFPYFGQAIAFAEGKKYGSAESVSILREGWGDNAGKFFLDLIMK